jgi:hypothetical protein
MAKEENRKSKDGKGSRFAGLLGIAGVGAAAGASTAAATAAAATATTAATAPAAAPAATAAATAGGAATDPLEVTSSPKPTDVHFPTTVPQPEETPADSKPSQAIDVPVPAEGTAVVEDTPAPAAETVDREEPTGTRVPTGEPITAVPHEDSTSQATPTPKGDSKVKSWIKSRFRTSSKTQKDMEEGNVRKPGFIGGATLTGTKADEAGGSPDRAKSDSDREVAMVGRSSTRETDDLYGSSEKAVSPVNDAADKTEGRSPSISSMSSRDLDEEGKPNAPRGRRGFKEKPVDQNDDFEEARDTFEEEKLTPPPKLSTLVEGGTPAKSSNSPSSRERSKFKEDL